MPPAPQLATIATIQAAISSLLVTDEPVFLAFGLKLFLAIATMMIVWRGLEWAFSSGHHQPEQVWQTVRLLLFLAIGYALIAFYESPIPGFGVSFSNLITDTCAWFMSILDARALEQTFANLDQLWSRFQLPDTWGIFSNLLYWALLIVVQVSKAVALVVVAWGLIASAVCGLLGPIFVPFLVVPRLNFLFWGWFKAFPQYSFMPVVAMAVLMIFQKFVFAFVTTLPPGITEDLYPLYLLNSLVIVATFAAGMVMVPALTRDLFSGSVSAGHGAVLAFLGRK